MDLGALLSTMKLVHLEGGQSSRLVLRQIDTLPCRKDRRPIARPYIVVGPSVKPPRGCQESIDRAKVGALGPPAEDEWLIKGIRKSSTAADGALNIGSEGIVGDRQSSRS